MMLSFCCLAPLGRRGSPLRVCLAGGLLLLLCLCLFERSNALRPRRGDPRSTSAANQEQLLLQPSWSSFSQISKPKADEEPLLPPPVQQQQQGKKKGRLARAAAAVAKAVMYIPRKVGGWFRRWRARPNSLYNRVHRRLFPRQAAAEKQPPPKPPRAFQRQQLPPAAGARGGRAAGQGEEQAYAPYQPPKKKPQEEPTGPRSGRRRRRVEAAPLLERKTYEPLSNVLLMPEMQELEALLPSFSLLWRALQKMRKSSEASRLARLLQANRVTPQTNLDVVERLPLNQRIDVEMAVLLARHLVNLERMMTACWFLELEKVEEVMTEAEKKMLNDTIAAFEQWMKRLGGGSGVTQIVRSLSSLPVDPNAFMREMSGFLPRVKAAFQEALPLIEETLNELGSAYQRFKMLQQRVAEEMPHDKATAKAIQLMVGGAACNLKAIEYMKTVVFEFKNLLQKYESRWFGWTKVQWLAHLGRVVYAFNSSAGRDAEKAAECSEMTQSHHYDPRLKRSGWYLYVFEAASLESTPIIWKEATIIEQ
ncbi:hypothetical protein Efla_001557 [Eimeria flavescens]